MATTNNFDNIYLNLPPLNKEIDFQEFWKHSINEFEKIPIDTEVERNESHSSKTIDCYDISYKSSGKAKVHGRLYLSKKAKRPKVIIKIPDYNQIENFDHELLNHDFACFILRLRGHEFIKKNNNSKNKQKEEKKTPGFMCENILDRELYYVKNIYLDTLRAIAMLRLIRKLDCSFIGILGKGLGASAAVFAASNSKRISALVLDTPSFCHIDRSQNKSKSDAANEINTFLANYKSKKRLVKKNLSYFDSINFSDKIKCPVLVTVGLKDIISPPDCVFALFNHFQCEKTIEVYPDEGNTAGGKNQILKSYDWLKKQV